MSEDREQPGREVLDVSNMPRALNYLINEVAELRSMLEEMRQQLQLGYDRRRPITVEKAAEIFGITKMFDPVSPQYGELLGEADIDNLVSKLMNQDRKF